jgi:integrase
MLLARVKEADKPTFVNPTARRRPISSLIANLRADYEIEGKMSPQTKSLLDKTDRRFGDLRGTDKLASAVDKYIRDEQEKNTPNASINRPIQMLSSALSFALKRGNLASVPKLRKLSEKGNERRDFLTADEVETIIMHLPEYLRPVARYAYATGSRSGEIKQLAWEMVEDNPETGGLRLRIPGHICKNKDDRIIPLTDELGLADLIEQQRAARSVDLYGVTVLSPWIFFHVWKRRKSALRQICPIGDFKKSWHAAAVAAGCGTMICGKCGASGKAVTCCGKPTSFVGKLFHGMRRSAARDMVLGAGLPEAVAMKITGHKTRAMFDRYNIVATKDVVAGQERLAAYRREQLAAEKKLVAIGGASR